MKNLKKDKEALTSQVDDLTSQHADMTSRVAQLTAEVEELRAQLHRVQEEGRESDDAKGNEFIGILYNAL